MYPSWEWEGAKGHREVDVGPAGGCAAEAVGDPSKGLCECECEWDGEECEMERR